MSRFSRSRMIGPAAIVVFLGCVIALFGYLRSSQPLSRTSGIITESTALSGMKSSMWRTVVYAYTVADQNYQGQSTVRNSLAHDASYQIGNSLPIFFVTSAPERSFAFSPPTALPWFLGSTLLVLLGGIIAYFAWTA